MATKPIGAGALFPEAAKSVFLRVTRVGYSNMLARVMRKGFYGLPFNQSQFRVHLLHSMGDAYDGFLRCRYCKGYFSIEQVAIDHAIPLSRGGGVELNNLEFPCQQDNNRKGSMKPEEYLALLNFLDNTIPLAKTDVLVRLEISVKLAAADAFRKKKKPPVTAAG